MPLQVLPLAIMSSTKRADEGASAAGTSPSKRRKRASNARLSCMECRRLKLKCDRQVPCGSCVKRGVQQVCPDGSLTTGQGNRFVLASTTELHEKISELSIRVRKLEDGLRESHAMTASEPHELLSEDLLKIKAPLEREVPHPATKEHQCPKPPGEEYDPTEVDAFGSLSITVSGRENYYGASANSWYFLMNETARDEEHATELADRVERIQNVLPLEVLARSAALGISTTSNLAVPGGFDRLIFQYLPTRERAEELCSIYYDLAAWMYLPISRSTFNEQIFSELYLNTPKEDSALCHKLSVLFMILAIGTLMDLKLPAYNIEAEKYHQLARAALFQSPVFDEPTIYAVQALFMMSSYLFLSDRHQTVSGARWAIMGMAVKLAQSIGLHRDSGRWKLEDVETLRRRQLFWELYTYDSWQCLTFGRPPSFSNAHIDCKMPYSENDTPEETFHAWKHKFTSECMTQWHDIAAKTPRYTVVLALDRKIRAFAVPAVLQVPGFGNSNIGEPSKVPETTQLMLQRHIVLAIRESNLLYLHRSFFARALTDSPNDPLQSDYGTSVIAAYRSAGSLVALIRNMHSQLPEVSGRLWFLYAHVFSCSIVLGSIVVRAPSLSLAPSALSQLDSAVTTFSLMAARFRAQPILDVMTKLQQKAHHSLNEFRNSKSLPSMLRGVAEPITPIDNTDELQTLGGQTRIITKKETPSPVESPKSFNASKSPISMVPLPLQTSSDHTYHPMVAEYLRSFNSPAPIATDPAAMENMDALASYGQSGSSYRPSMQSTSSYGPNQQMAYQPPQQSPPIPRQQHISQHGLPSPPIVNYSSLPTGQAPVGPTSYTISQDYNGVSRSPEYMTTGAQYIPHLRASSLDYPMEQFQAAGAPRQRQSSNGELKQQQVHHHQHVHHIPRPHPPPQPLPNPPTFGGGSMDAFPSYFPVFDYAPPGVTGQNMYDGQQLEFSSFNRRSGSPTGQDRTWQEFVDGLEMQ